MSGLSDAQAAVAALGTTVGNLGTAVTTELSALQAAAGDPDATVESLAQSINTANTNINSIITQVNAALPAVSSGQAPAPTPTPAAPN